MRKLLYFFVLNLLFTQAYSSCPLTVTCGAVSNPICIGPLDQLTATASGGNGVYNYSWSGPGIVSFDRVATSQVGIGTFQYTVVVTDGNGCTGSCSFNLTINPNTVVVSAGNDVTICSGGSAQLQGSANGSFTWSPTAGLANSNTLTPTASPPFSIDYTLCSTDANCTLCDTVKVKIDAFTVQGSPQNACGNCDGKIIPTVSGGMPPFSYLWSPGGYTTGVLNNLCEGTYTVAVTDNVGCQNIRSFTVLKKACCIVNDSIGNDAVNVCERSPFTFTAPFHAGSKYQWTTYGDSTHSIDNNSITVIWKSVPSSYYLGAISYTETFSNGSTQTHYLSYVIIQAPKISITSPLINNKQINICRGQAVSITNNTSNADFFVWRFGDGDSTSSRDIKHTYSSAGTYVLTLEAGNGCGCSATDSITVNVSSDKGPDIECRSMNCTNDTGAYSTSAVCNSYNWSVTGGTILTQPPFSNNIKVLWNGNTNGTIKLSVGSCLGPCSDTSYLIIPIVAQNGVVTGPDTLCYNSPQLYSVPLVPGNAYTWQANPSSAAQIKNINSNEVLVTLFESCTLTVTYSNDFLGCSGSASKQITVSAEIFLSGQSPVCKATQASVSASLDNYSGAFKYTVINPQGNSSITNAGNTFNFNVTDTGIYKVFAVPSIPALYCKLPDTLFIRSETTASLDSISGPAQICFGESYTYTLHGAKQNHFINWGAKGGTLAAAAGMNQTTANVTWDKPAPHTLWAMQSDTYGNGCNSDTIFFTATELTSATISGPSTVCANGVYNYSVNVADLPGAYYDWTVTSSLASIKNGQGTKQITVEYHNATGVAAVKCILRHCSAIVAQLNNIQVVTSPPPSVTPNDPYFCAGSSVTVQSAATAAAYQWQDSTGAVVGSSQSFAVTKGGTYTLITFDANQCRGLRTFFVSEKPKPVTTISTPDPTSFCIPTPISTTLYAATNPDYKYQWLLNSVPIPGATNAVYTATQAGSYRMNVANSFDCQDTSDAINVIAQNCNGGGTCTTSETIDAITTINYCNPVSFTVNASSGVSNISWSFGDIINNTSTLISPSHDYSKTGYFTAVASGTVVNQTAPPPTCSIMDTAQVLVLGKCDFTFEAACAGTPSHFIDKSLTHPGTTVSSYSWDFGDGGSSSLESPQHIYAAGGTYNVTLQITYDVCTESKTYAVKIPGASASFTTNLNPLCAGSPVQFNATNNGTSPFIDYHWDFGDTISDLNNTPVRAYQSSGNKTATLIVADAQGCRDTVQNNLFVNAAAAAGNINPGGPITQCASNSVALTAPSGATYLWSNNSTDQLLDVNTTGKYFVTVTDNNNCIYTTPPVEVNLLNVPAAMISGVNEICEGGYVDLIGTPGPSFTYEWRSLPFNTLINSSNNYNVYLPAGTYPIYLVVKDVNNCIDTSNVVNVKVTAKPTDPVLTSLPTGYLCSGSNTMLHVSNPTNGTYMWSSGVTTTSPSPDIMVTKAGDYSVTFVDNASGCKATSNVITVQPHTDFREMVSGCYTMCDTVQHYIQGKGCQGIWIDVSLNPAQIASSTPTLWVTQSGQYKYVCTQMACADTSEALNITLRHCCPNDPPTADLTYAEGKIVSSITAPNYNYSWLKNNDTIPGETQPNLQNVGEGCYTLVVADESRCSTCSNTICITFTNVIDVDKTPRAYVFPNPANNIVQFQREESIRAELKIVDATARLVYQKPWNGKTVELDITDLAEGTYYYSITSEDGIQNGKFVIVHKD